MRATAAAIRSAVRPRLGRWLAIALGTVALYYAGLLAALVYRFGNWPNYAVPYDWPANVARIFRSTPSRADALGIAREEWLLEVGYMNMSFGRGISEWSLTLVPPKMIVIAALGALLATAWALIAERRRVCAAAPGLAPVAATGLGAGFVGLTGATMSWVVCCATPSWIVGLAMLGMSVATANWLEPAGTYLSLAGFALLGLGIARLARDLQAPAAGVAQAGLNPSPASA